MRTPCEAALPEDRRSRREVNDMVARWWRGLSDAQRLGVLVEFIDTEPDEVEQARRRREARR